MDWKEHRFQGEVEIHTLSGQNTADCGAATTAGG